MTGDNNPPRRSAGILPRRRERLDWQSNQPFRILSIDGGGIRGIFPAAILADLEYKYLDGEAVTEYFDLITGTSTGGILALGLAAGLKASELLGLYMKRGRESFPPERRIWRKILQYIRTGYKREPLDRILEEVLEDMKLRDSQVRLCIPSLDLRYGDVYVFKTPHHPEFKKRRRRAHGEGSSRHVGGADIF